MCTVTETPLAATLRSEPAASPHTAVEIVVPVFDEELELAASIRALHGYLTDRFTVTWAVTIADNASTDRTWSIAEELVASLPGVTCLHLDQKGRGRALRTAWAASTAEVVAYMDVDLSTDLDANRVPIAMSL